MTSQEVAATVMELPNTMSVKQGRRFLSELKTSMSDDCPCIVLDCSKVRVMNRSTIHMLLCCLEEVMKHNGDVRLGAVSVGATSTLDVTGVGHLFEIFETNEEALDSFRMPPADGALQISVPDSSHEAA
jgi:anti-anti-sigma factor